MSVSHSGECGIEVVVMGDCHVDSGRALLHCRGMRDVADMDKLGIKDGIHAAVQGIIREPAAVVIALYGIAGHGGLVSGDGGGIVAGGRGIPLRDVDFVIVDECVGVRLVIGALVHAVNPVRGVIAGDLACPEIGGGFQQVLVLVTLGNACHHHFIHIQEFGMAINMIDGGVYQRIRIGDVFFHAQIFSYEGIYL